MVASLLEVHGVPYVAVDSDPDRVAAVRDKRQSVFWGDITRAELLHRLHIDTARALVVTMSDHDASDRLVAVARAQRGDLLIVVRARDRGTPRICMRWARPTRCRRRWRPACNCPRRCWSNSAFPWAR